jgi:hypothetical protein
MNDSEKNTPREEIQSKAVRRLGRVAPYLFSAVPKRVIRMDVGCALCWIIW